MAKANSTNSNEGDSVLFNGIVMLVILLSVYTTIYFRCSTHKIPLAIFNHIAPERIRPQMYTPIELLSMLIGSILGLAASALFVKTVLFPDLPKGFYQTDLPTTLITGLLFCGANIIGAHIAVGAGAGLGFRAGKAIKNECVRRDMERA
jgi:hypothetical protein